MNFLSSYLRSSLRSAWSGGLAAQTRRAAIVAPLLVLCGFFGTYLFPSLSENILAVLTQTIDTTGIAELTGMDAAAMLFSNNLSAAFSALLWGLVPFAYLSALPLGFNFFVLGVMAAHYVQSGIGLGVFFVGILPHGIFELPALVLFCAAGLHLCECTTARMRGNRERGLLQTLSELAVFYLYVVLPLLAAAALVESFITPHLLTLVLG